MDRKSTAEVARFSAGTLVAALLVAAAALALIGFALMGAQHVRSRNARADARERILRSAAEVEGRIAGADNALRAEARRLAELKVIRAAVETDADTVHDLAQADTTFRVATGTALELLQIRDQQESVLLRVPQSAPPLPAHGGTRVHPDGSVWVAARVPVAPLYGQAPGSGALLLSHKVELGAVAGSIVPLAEAPNGPRSALIGDDGELALIGPPPPVVGNALGSIGVVLLLLGVAGGAAVGIASRSRLAARLFEPSFKIRTGVQKTGVQNSTETPRSAPSPAAPTPLSPEPPPSPAERTPTPAAGLHGSLGKRYRIFREVGAGPHAQVYLALSFQRPGVAEEVALKVWNGIGDGAATDFLDGAIAVARLSHPNLVRVHEFGAQDGTAWLAMEFVDGWNLANLLAELRKSDERMPLRHVLTIGMALCRGLHAAHTAVDSEARPLRLVHGAIKPSNVLICRDGTVKLGDFAAASPRAAEPLATADYLAPEQASGVLVDERADVYAVGALLHELASGSHVHFALPGPHAADRRAFARPRLLQLRPDAPPRLDTAIAHALEFTPTDRFGSCRALLRELEAVLEQDLPLEGATSGVLGDWAEGVRHLSRVVAPAHRK